jgi:hypothetical protein
VCGQDAFEVVAGGGAYELAGLGREKFGNGPRVGALYCFTGEDHRAGIDPFPIQPRVRVAARDEGTQALRVDRPVGEEWRHQDRRLPQHAPLDHHELARQRLRLALQAHGGEHEVRGRAADIDPDGGELDVLDLPDVFDELATPPHRHFVDVLAVTLVKGYLLARLMKMSW